MRHHTAGTSPLRAVALAVLIACAASPCRGSTRPAPREAAASPTLLVGSIALSTSEDEPEAPAQVVLGPDGRDLHLNGVLTEGVADRVARVLAAHPRVERLHLTSEGGLVEEGMALGALVAAHGLATVVDDTCASACTLVFVRGRGRYLAAGGRLGFHGPYETGFFEAVRQVDAAPERTAYLNAGLEPDFVAQALAVPAAAMWMPDAARLRAAGVVTAVIPLESPSVAVATGPGARVGHHHAR